MSTRTLALRLAGPAQSWASAPYAIKMTEGVPTRSAILGMLAGALGIHRGPLPGWLHDTVITARVDRPGTVVVDFHTISPPPADIAANRARSRIAASGGTDTKPANYTVGNGSGNAWIIKGFMPTMITERAFLADAEFIVAVSHPDDVRFDEIVEAVGDPVFMPYLGRKAFAPAFPFNLGVHELAAHDLFVKLPTSSISGRKLAVHDIEQDKNYARSHVAPVAAATRDDLWKGWKVA